jgi:HTH-type transcriptional regulator / antitoxin HigA
MRQLRTLDKVTEQYFRDHPEEIDDYLAEIFQAYAEDNDSGTLLASLRILALVCPEALTAPTSKGRASVVG